MVPKAPMMPSDGLATISGSRSTGRKPGLSSRTKQSCRLLNSVFLASDRSRSENSLQHRIEKSLTSGFSILLNQPMKRVRAARGTRLVRRKLRSSCWVREAIRLFIVMNLSAGVASALVMDTSFPILSLGAVAATVAVAPRVKARIELSRAKHRSLAGHSKMSRRMARLVPFYEFDINDFFRTDDAPNDIATKRQDGFFRLAALYQQRFAQSRKATAEAATRISDLQFTQAYRVPFQFSRLVRENLGAGSFLQATS